MFHKKYYLIGLILSIWYAGSTLSYHPYYLSYFNASIGARKNAYKYLADSNLDWGHTRLAVRKFLSEHPEVKAGASVPKLPGAGTFLIGSNELLGLLSKEEEHAWLRDHFEPVRHVAYSHLLFEVTQEDVNRLKRDGMVKKTN